MLTMCDENVDSDCSMLCSSPMSARTCSNTEISLRSEAGIIRPHIVISVSSPTVLSDTVFPPVFGPVITSVSKFSPNDIDVGTTFFWSISGCRASLRLTRPSEFSLGRTAFIV